MGRVYSFFTEEQQKVFDSLKESQQKYIEYRAKGYNKAAAYRLAGYGTKRAPQAAHILENRNKIIKDLIFIMTRNKLVKQIGEEPTLEGRKGELNEKIDALVTQEKVEQAIKIIEGADSETARRIQFFRDIVDGSIKTVKRTKKYSGDGRLLETRVEETSDIETRIKARRELDNILGLTGIVDINKLSFGDITINIVDASKKEELEDSRNKVNLEIQGEEVINGEKVIVVEDRVEKAEEKKPSKKTEFLERQQNG